MTYRVSGTLDILLGRVLPRELITSYLKRQVFIGYSFIEVNFH